MVAEFPIHTSLQQNREKLDSLQLRRLWLSVAKPNNCNGVGFRYTQPQPVLKRGQRIVFEIGVQNLIPISSVFTMSVIFRFEEFKEEENLDQMEKSVF